MLFPDLDFSFLSVLLTFCVYLNYSPTSRLPQLLICLSLLVGQKRCDGLGLILHLVYGTEYVLIHTHSLDGHVYICMYVCMCEMYLFLPSNIWLSWKPASALCKNTSSILALIAKELYFWKELNWLTLLFTSWSDVSLILIA